MCYMRILLCVVHNLTFEKLFIIKISAKFIILIVMKFVIWTMGIILYQNRMCT